MSVPRRSAGSFYGSARSDPSSDVSRPSRRPSREAMAASSGGAYVRAPDPWWVVTIAVGMTYYGWAVLLPETIPYDYLGPLGTFTKYLVENHKTLLDVGYGISWLVHVVETLYALKLCKEKGITDGSAQFRWAVQTFFFGFASLNHLKAYEPPRKQA